MWVRGGSMVATRLVIGIACWLMLCSPSHAAPTDQTDASPLFDNLGDRKSVV